MSGIRKPKKMLGHAAAMFRLNTLQFSASIALERNGKLTNS
jgi:hypothetical protein